jgi:LysM repeat protein
VPQAQGNRPQEHQQTYRPHGPRDEYPVSCGGDDYIYNGSFEAGFVDVPWGVVGKGWEAFTNGGAANYGFYDEQWDIVVADGNHGQLIEINSKAIFPTDPDRYAGISQRISGLHPGATYELTLRGGLRGVGNEDDPYRFAAQWGLGTPEGWQSVEEWTTMDLGPIGVRTEPLPLAQYKVQFEAPSQGVVLYIRGWKKWAITNVEMDFNLDAISLRSCDTRGQSKPHGGEQQPQYPGTGGPSNRPDHPGQGNPCNNPCGNQGGNPGGHHDDEYRCTYVVQRGDTLSQIALDHGVSLDAMIRANGIDDPSTIFVGQELVIPGCGGQQEAYGPVNQVSNNQTQPTQQWEIVQGERPAGTVARSGPAISPNFEESAYVEQAEAAALTYTVQEGDMLSYIAQAYNVSAYSLASFNGIEDTDFIYTGQVLAIPD